MALSDPPSRDELDDLFSLACAEAIACGWLVVTNPLPADALPLELYRDLVADVRANGCRTLVDLSTPRIEFALEAKPDLVKLNDVPISPILLMGGIRDYLVIGDGYHRASAAYRVDEDARVPGRLLWSSRAPRSSTGKPGD